MINHSYMGSRAAFLDLRVFKERKTRISCVLSSHGDGETCKSKSDGFSFRDEWQTLMNSGRVDWSGKDKSCKIKSPKASLEATQASIC